MDALLVLGERADLTPAVEGAIRRAFPRVNLLTVYLSEATTDRLKVIGLVAAIQRWQSEATHSTDRSIVIFGAVTWSILNWLSSLMLDFKLQLHTLVVKRRELSTEPIYIPPLDRRGAKRDRPWLELLD